MSILRESSRRRMIRRSLALAMGQYRGADLDRLRSDWIFGTASEPDTDAWEKLTLIERARDLARNDTVAAGALDTISDNVVGYGLNPQSRIEATVLGWSEEQAEEFQRVAEWEFRRWSPNADVAGRLQFEDIQTLILQGVLRDGEMLAKRAWVEGEPWRSHGTALECIEGDQLKDGFGEDAHGIKLGSRGQPEEYIFRKSDGEDKRVKARDDQGRRNIFHLYHVRRAGQVRGYSFFAPALTLFKDRADTLEAEVVTARVLACFGVFIETEAPYDMAVANATVDGEQKQDASGNRLEYLEPGFVHYLKAGEKVNAADPRRPSSNMPGFMEHVLRAIAASLGIPYELLFKDFSKTNYSSARAALLEAWRFFMKWRKWIVRHFCQPIYELVLEESAIRGQLPFIDNGAQFLAQKEALCRAIWIGPGRGWVDPMKETQAANLARENFLSTLADEAAHQGKDWEETLEQAAREQRKMKELGLEFSSNGRQPDTAGGDTKEEIDDAGSGEE